MIKKIKKIFFEEILQEERILEILKNYSFSIVSKEGKNLLLSLEDNKNLIFISIDRINTNKKIKAFLESFNLETK